MNKRNILTLTATIMLSAIVATAFDIHTKGKLQFRDMKQSFLQAADSALSMRPSRTSIATHQGYMVEVFITVNADCDLQKLEEVGLRDSEVLSEHTIVGSIAASEVETLSSVEGVVKVSLSGTGRLNNDISRSLTHVDEIHDGISGLPQPYTGEGVLVSLYDSGIQPLHINFMNEHKLVDDKVLESRVKAIYNYQASEDDYGNVSITEQAYTSPEEIAQFSTDDTNETHGTHTLGIMTGSYTSKDFTAESQNDFRGMAPDADIFVTCGPIYYTAIAKAINRIINYAEAKEQPVVINLSIGDNVGPHDGTDGFAAFLNECGAKTPIVLSAGNEGNISISINKRFTDDDNEIRTTIVPRNTIRYYLGVDYEACTEMQIWSEDDTPFTLELGLINKITGDTIYTLPYKDDGSVTYIANGVFESVSTVEPNDEFNYYYTDSAIGVATGLAEENHRYCASVYYLLKKEMSHIDRHIVPFLIVKGEPGKRVDIYSDGDYNELSSNKISGWDNGSGNGSISNIACGENVISVGAYRSRQMIDSDPIAVGEVCDFSSYGELSDGRVLPDILAPGGWIASSMSTPFTESDYFSIDNYPAVDGMMYGDMPYYWTIEQGTSQSSPAVAGIIALWLQANPQLTPREIKDIIYTTAIPCDDPTTQSCMGKIDALAGIKKALELSAVPTINSQSKAVLIASEEDNRWRIAIAGEQYLDIAIYALQGECVLTHKHLSAEDTLDLSNLYHGAYILQAKGLNNSICKKIIIK